MPRQKLATWFAMVDPDVHWCDEIEAEFRRSSIYDPRSGQWLPPDGQVSPDALAGLLIIDTERVEEAWAAGSPWSCGARSWPPSRKRRA